MSQLSARHHCPPRRRRATDFFACGVSTAATPFSRAAAVEEKSGVDLFLCKTHSRNLRAISINGQKNKADVARTQRETQRAFLLTLSRSDQTASRQHG